MSSLTTKQGEKKMSSRYAILLKSSNPLVDVFVSEQETEWRTMDMSEAKTWKTRAGAERFFRGRTGLEGKVIVVQIGRRSGKPCGLIGVSTDGAKELSANLREE